MALPVFFSLSSYGQIKAFQQSTPPTDFENVHVEKLFSNKQASSFKIWVKKGVKAHKHLVHTEHVYVLEGTGMMTLASDTLTVKPGDVIFIPENTVHSVRVTSEIPMVVLSIQAPEFLGKDRVFVE